MKCAAPSGAASFWDKHARARRPALGERQAASPPSASSSCTFLGDAAYGGAGKRTGSRRFDRARFSRSSTAIGGLGKNAPCCHRDDAPPIEQGRSGLEETEDV